MGDATDPLLTGGALDPTIKAQLIVQAGTVPDAKAQDICDIADATPLGKNLKLKRIGGGAAAGLVVGAVLVFALKKKRR